MKKNDRKGDLKALAAALNTELSDQALRAVAGGQRIADETHTVTVEKVTRCCWG